MLGRAPQKKVLWLGRGHNWGEYGITPVVPFENRQWLGRPRTQYGNNEVSLSCVAAESNHFPVLPVGLILLTVIKSNTLNPLPSVTERMGRYSPSCDSFSHPLLPPVSAKSFFLPDNEQHVSPSAARCHSRQHNKPNVGDVETWCELTIR